MGHMNYPEQLVTWLGQKERIIVDTQGFKRDYWRRRLTEIGVLDLAKEVAKEIGLEVPNDVRVEAFNLVVDNPDHDLSNIDMWVQPRPLDGSKPDNTIYVNRITLDRDLAWFQKAGIGNKGLRLILAAKYLHELHHLANVYDDVLVDFSVAQAMIQRFKGRAAYIPE